jgi:hypothetical protein
MRLDPPSSPASPIVWFAVLGAPFAWGIEFAVGYWATQNRCGVTGQVGSTDAGLWAGILMGLAFAVAAVAGLTALGLFRGSHRAETDGAPPDGRVRFLSVVGMTVTVLFILIIVMTGVGLAIVPQCRQS